MKLLNLNFGKTGLLLLLTYLLSHPVLSNEKCGLNGLAIMENWKKKYEVESETVTYNVIIVDNNGKKDNRVLKQIHKNNRGESRTMLAFISPVMIQGSALLNWEQEESGSIDQWVYLPSLKKTQRIADGSKTNYFMNTDFTYGDLEKEKLSLNQYYCEKIVPCNGGECFKVVAEAKEAKTKRLYGYQKRIFLFEKDSLAIQSIDFYDLKGQLAKNLKNLEFDVIKGRKWPKISKMERVEGGKTFFKVENREINSKIESTIFTPKAMLAGAHIK
jgi:hypothetical protein